jgi:enoyl-CoA hydratase/carnithine racemase
MNGAPPISLHIEGPIARLRFERPEKRNALSIAMWRAIPGLLRNAEADANVRVLIVEGSGGSFSAGADIGEFAETYATREAALSNQSTIEAAMEALEAFPLPTVAAIEGACVGGGCGFALCADLRWADETARMGITPSKLGLIYGVSDTRRLVQAAGLANAKLVLFTGRIFPASDARALGLIDHIAPAGALEDAWRALAQDLLAASSATARATKQIIRLLQNGAHTDTAESRELFAASFSSKDFQEGFAAFLAKRRPVFG